MKILRTYFISHLQLTISLLLCAMLLLVVSICAALSYREIRRNALEVARWQSEALARNAERALANRFREPFPESGSPDFEGVSLRLQLWLERYQDSHIEEMGIIHWSGHWLAHQNASFRGSIVPEEFLAALEDREPRLISGTELYQSLTPFTGQDDRYKGMIYIGLSKAPFSARIRQHLITHALLFTLLVLVLVGSFLRLTRETFLAIQTLIHTSTAISSGDLTSTEIRVRGIGDVRQLTRAFRNMAHKLHAITLQVQNAVSLTKTVSGHMLKTTERLAVSLEEQSASIAQTSSNMENVAQASQQISNSTDHVVHIAETTRNDAQQGQHIAQETLDKMGDIQQSHQTDARNIQELQRKSQEISKIMDVIVGIADQTKLIAFNASLEAAGAGQAGRRFSIVAQEIRMLADNVIGSTATIRQSIAEMQASVQNLQRSFEGSTERIQQGAEYTTRMTEWLQAILNGTGQTTRAAQKISRSLLKQQLASEEISAALKEQLSNTGEFAQTGAMTREIAEQLESLTEELKQVISTLKVSRVDEQGKF